jgi:hypothetical protein
MPHRQWAAAGWVFSVDPRFSDAGRVSFITTGTLCQRSSISPGGYSDGFNIRWATRGDIKHGWQSWRNEQPDHR